MKILCHIALLSLSLELSILATPDYNLSGSLTGTGTSQQLGYRNTICLSGNGKKIALLTNPNGPWTANDNASHLKVYTLGNDTIDLLITKEEITNWAGTGLSLNNDGTILALGNGRIYDISSGEFIHKGTIIQGDVSLNAEGNRVAVASLGTSEYLESHSYLQNGIVQVFELIENDWVQVGENINNPSLQNEKFGCKVKLSASGNDLIVFSAGYGEIDGSNSYSPSNQKGKVSIFTFENGTWQHKGQDILGEYEFTRFGESIDISENGNVIAIGYRGNGWTSATPPPGQGSYSYPAKVYEYSSSNSEWVQKGSNFYTYGIVDIDSTGNILLTGDGANNGSGIARLYQFENDDWSLIKSFTSPDNVNSSHGYNVLMDSSGSNIIICQPWYKPDNPDYRLGRIFSYSTNKNLLLSLNSLYESNLNESVFVNATPSEGYPRDFTYQWYFNNFPIPSQFGGTSSGYTINGDSINNGIWKVIVSNSIDSISHEFEYRLIVDNDEDGIQNLHETNTGIYISPSDTGTDPDNPDTDGDSILDGTEVTNGTNPNLADTDSDGLNDYLEEVYGADPNLADTSGDGLEDALVVNSGFDPAVDYSNLINISRQGMADLRVGSTIIEVEDGQATLSMEVEQSDDLEIWTSGGTTNLQVPVDPSSDTKFFRFKMAE